jgi:hypothetical protein
VAQLAGGAGGGMLGQPAMPGGSIAGLCGGGGGGQLPSPQMQEVVQQSEGQGGHGEDDLGALKKPRWVPWLQLSGSASVARSALLL